MARRLAYRNWPMPSWSVFDRATTTLPVPFLSANTSRHWSAAASLIRSMLSDMRHTSATSISPRS